MSLPPLFNQLEKEFTGELLGSGDQFAKYAQDGSLCQVTPLAVAFPKNISDLIALVLFSKHNAVPIVARGNGLGRSGGALLEGVIVDLSRYFDSIVAVNQEKETITVEAGVTLEEVQRKLDSFGLELPITISEPRSTMGAMLSERSSGSRSQKHGSIREWVESVEFILSSGEICTLGPDTAISGELQKIYEKVLSLTKEYHPVIRANRPHVELSTSGYDVWHPSVSYRFLLDILIGSQGTLSIFTKVTLRTQKKVKNSVHILMTAKEERLLNTMATLTHEYQPEEALLYDGNALTFYTAFNEHSAESIVDKEMLYTLVITLSEENIGVLEKKRDSLIQKASRVGLDCKEINKDLWKIHRTIATDQIHFLREYTKGREIPLLVADDIVVPLIHLQKCAEEIKDIFHVHGLLYTVGGSPCEGKLSFIPLIDMHKTQAREFVLTLVQEVVTAVKRSRGSITSENGDGMIRSPFLSILYNEEMMNLFTLIKLAFDPLNLLNPGKKVGSDITYLRNHLTTEDPISLSQ